MKHPRCGDTSLLLNGFFKAPHYPESNHRPTNRSHLSAEPSVPASGTDNSRSFDRESVSLSHVPTPVPQADETPRLEHKLLLVQAHLFKVSHCLSIESIFPQADAKAHLFKVVGNVFGTASDQDPKVRHRFLV